MTVKERIFHIVLCGLLAFAIGFIVGIGSADARGFHRHQTYNWGHDPYYGIHPALRPFVDVGPIGPQVITVDPDVEPDRDRVLRQLRECKPVRVCTDSECFVHPASECDVKDPWK